MLMGLMVVRLRGTIALAMLMELMAVLLPGTMALESPMVRTEDRLPGVMVPESPMGLTAVQPPGTDECFKALGSRELGIGYNPSAKNHNNKERLNFNPS
jgi:hypothetical protein